MPVISIPLVSLLPPPNYVRLGTAPPGTRTLPPKLIHHQAIAKLKVALTHVHTEDDLRELESGIDDMM
jgi:hypothetical protein